MNFAKTLPLPELRPQTREQIERILSSWEAALAEYGRDGGYLFGAFSIADCMYAPVVSRFHTYGIAVGAEAQAYMARVMALPAWAEWRAAALKEPWVLPHDEPDWPIVLRA